MSTSRVLEALLWVYVDNVNRDHTEEGYEESLNIRPIRIILDELDEYHAFWSSLVLKLESDDEMAILFFKDVLIPNKDILMKFDLHVRRDILSLTYTLLKHDHEDVLGRLFFTESTSTYKDVFVSEYAKVDWTNKPDKEEARLMCIWHITLTFNGDYDILDDDLIYQMPTLFYIRNHHSYPMNQDAKLKIESRILQYQQTMFNAGVANGIAYMKKEIGLLGARLNDIDFVRSIQNADVLELLFHRIIEFANTDTTSKPILNHLFKKLSMGTIVELTERNGIAFTRILEYLFKKKTTKLFQEFYDAIISSWHITYANAIRMWAFDKEHNVAFKQSFISKYMLSLFNMANETDKMGLVQFVSAVCARDVNPHIPTLQATNLLPNVMNVSGRVVLIENDLELTFLTRLYDIIGMFAQHVLAEKSPVKTGNKYYEWIFYMFVFFQQEVIFGKYQLKEILETFKLIFEYDADCKDESYRYIEQWRDANRNQSILDTTKRQKHDHQQTRLDRVRDNALVTHVNTHVSSLNRSISTTIKRLNRLVHSQVSRGVDYTENDFTIERIREYVLASEKLRFIRKILFHRVTGDEESDEDKDKDDDVVRIVSELQQEVYWVVSNLFVHSDDAESTQPLLEILNMLRDGKDDPYWTVNRPRFIYELGRFKNASLRTGDTDVSELATEISKLDPGFNNGKKTKSKRKKKSKPPEFTDL